MFLNDIQCQGERKHECDDRKAANIAARRGYECGCKQQRNQGFQRRWPTLRRTDRP
jgi:hypothetical protein